MNTRTTTPTHASPWRSGRKPTQTKLSSSHPPTSSDECGAGEQWVATTKVGDGLGLGSAVRGPRAFGVIAEFDVVESCERQSAFLWQVSGSRYNDPDFLAEGVTNYSRFLRLMKTHPTAFLVPTYQTDLMWHSHMLASAKSYAQDCATLAGTDPRSSGVDHDDSVNDRSSQDTKLNVSTDSTKTLWLEAYGVPFAVEGGMYRGPAPPCYWRAEWHPTASSGEEGEESEEALKKTKALKTTKAEMLKTKEVPNKEALLRSQFVWDAITVGPTMATTSQQQTMLTSVAPTTMAIGRDERLAGPPPFSPALNVNVVGGAPSGAVTDEPTITMATSLASMGSQDTVYGMTAAELTPLEEFIPANPKAAAVNANPPKEGFVFGEGPNGAGYYRLDTLQADTLVVKRLQARTEYLKEFEENRLTNINGVDNRIVAMETARDNSPCCCKGLYASLVDEIRDQHERAKWEQEQLVVIRSLLADGKIRKSTQPGIFKEYESSKPSPGELTANGATNGGASCGAIYAAGCGAGTHAAGCGAGGACGGVKGVSNDSVPGNGGWAPGGFKPVGNGTNSQSGIAGRAM
mmetsp:Transcript_31374/g.63696  ORF Transcript_31374/g.63696 Transcript_31374/m.63696 type:complete len:575 (+) Transcript_31374:746-2470(+)